MATEQRNMKYIFKIIILLLFLSCTKNQSKSALNQINEVPLDTINAETLINDIYRSKGYNSISKIDNLKRNVSITINYIEGDSALNSLPELYSIQKNLFDSKSIVRTIIQVKGKKYIYYDQIHGPVLSKLCL